MCGDEVRALQYLCCRHDDSDEEKGEVDDGEDPERVQLVVLERIDPVWPPSNVNSRVECVVK